MDEWRSTTWGDLATLEYGKGLRGYQDVEGPCRVYGTNGPIGWHTEPLYHGPSVIVGRKGAYRGIHYAPKPFYVIDTAFYLKPKVSIDIRWAYYELLTHDINGMDSGSAIPSTSREAFYLLPVLLPPINKQQEIAALLGALDDKIDLNRRMNDTLEAIARAFFKDWFVDFGPTRAKAEGRPPYLAPELWALFPEALDDADIPTGWDVRPVYEIASFINGAAYKNMHFSSNRDGFPVIRIAELKSGVTLQTQFTTTDLGERYKIQTGDILFSWSGNPDTSIDVFIWDGGLAWLNQHIFRVRDNGNADRSFIYFQLKELKPIFAEIARNKQTTGLGHVTAQDMKELMVCDPSRNVADTYNMIAGPIFSRIMANLLETRTLAQLRDLLLPKLMSGEIRLKDVEKAVEEHL